MPVPIAAPEACEELRAEVDEIVCAVTPALSSAVGLWYRDFSQTTDEEVRELLARAARPHQLSRQISDGEHGSNPIGDFASRWRAKEVMRGDFSEITVAERSRRENHTHDVGNQSQPEFDVVSEQNQHPERNGKSRQRATASVGW
jgi:hypothetical protein